MKNRIALGSPRIGDSPTNGNFNVKKYDKTMRIWGNYNVLRCFEENPHMFVTILYLSLGMMIPNFI